MDVFGLLSNLDQVYPDFALLRDAADECAIRRATARDVEVLDYDGDWSGSEDCFSPGTIALILARSGSNMFQQLYDNLKEKGIIDRDLINTIRDTYARRQVVPLADAVSLMKKQDTIADLLGGRFTLAANLFVPDDMDVVLVPMPYNGGPIEGIQFTIVERFKYDGAASLKAFIVRRRPHLSAAEEAALRLVPQDALDLPVGRAAKCYAITAVTIVGAVIAATYACPGLASEPHLSEEEIAQLGPELSARRLLQLRRKALERRL
jgi:hypothetical protein